MKKINVLDTNVFLSDPKALFNFPEELIVIPISVIDELDEFKKGQNELGRNARFVLKKIDKLRKRGKITDASQAESSTHGIELNNRGRLIIELNHMDKIPKGLSEDKVDNRILAVAKHYKDANPNAVVTLITQDANLRIKSDAYGVPAVDYESPQNQTPDSLYKGYRDVKLEESFIKDLRKNKTVEFSKDGNPNEFLIIDGERGQEVAQIKTQGDKKILRSLEEISAVYGITALNSEQVLALSLLLDPEIPLVTITGKAGTGKTLLAVAAALHQTLDSDDLYTKVLISRPVFPLGKDIGFLPGTMEEKLDPWMQPIYDNLEFIFSQGKSRKSTRQTWRELIEQNILKVEGLTYIRGRSIPQQFMIIDEAQNLTLHEVKTIVTRAGKGTKLVFTGDPEQIDNPYVDSQSNGLTQLIERLKDDELTGHVHLEKGERSPLAEMASKKLG